MFKLRPYLVKPAAAICLALGSTSAMAYLPVTETNTNAVTLYWGGATASTLSAMETAVTAVCLSTTAADTHILYVPAGTAPDAKRPGNDWAVACTTSFLKTGLPDGTRVLIVKRDRGGSGVGVGPVQSPNSITFLAATSPGNCSTVGVPGVNGAPAINNPGIGGLVPLQECGANYTTSRVTEMGTSDIEPDKFFGINTPVVDGAPYPFISGVPFAERATLGALAFNTPVTLTLRNALQTAQLPANCVGNETEACMPSLTRSEIASIMTGAIANWNQLLNNAGAPLLAGSFPVQICRRVPGSGTQAVINALIMSWPGDPDSDGSINIAPPRVHNGTTVIAGEGSSNVDTCLHTFNGTANPYAIGTMSVEGRNANNARGYRFIKVNGVAPTLRNIHAGDTEMWAQQSCQRRSLADNASTSGVDITGNKTLVYRSICGGTGTTAPNSLNSPTALALLNNNAVYSWGQSGWLASPNSVNVLPLPPTLNLAAPINMFTRDALGRSLNILQTPLKATAGANASRGMIVAPNPIWTP